MITRVVDVSYALKNNGQEIYRTFVAVVSGVDLDQVRAAALREVVSLVPDAYGIEIQRVREEDPISVS